jgi:hypothetical protein
MITGFIFGAVTMLIGAATGYTMGKTWLDKRFNKPTPKAP